MDAINYHEEITREGLNFAHQLCEAQGDLDEVDDVLAMYDAEKLLGGSATRVVCTFPDEFVTDRAQYLDNQYHDTFFVLKACYRPNPQNYREVYLWNETRESGVNTLFAPIHAWDGAYRWLIMKRVTPVSPAERDIAYLQNEQEYYHDEEASETVEDMLNDHGWEVVDADENTAYHEERDYLCLMDYGGVRKIDGEINIPDWVTA